MLEQHFTHLCWWSETRRADGKDLEEEHVRGGEGKVVLGQGGKWAVSAEEKGTHHRLVDEQSAKMCARISFGRREMGEQVLRRDRTVAM